MEGGARRRRDATRRDARGVGWRAGEGASLEGDFSADLSTRQERRGWTDREVARDLRGKGFTQSRQEAMMSPEQGGAGGLSGNGDVVD